ncbi:hypothetical protein FB451DRAFT_1292217 [Mycena latifolia]|nr:hypothetical protein FB451DRAFT_1292217 [Mycena latifolia]
MTGNTLPRYVSTPPTPVVADARVGFVQPQPGRLGAAAAGENADEGRRRRHPSFRVMPPEEDVQQGIASPVACDPEHGDGEAMPGALEFPSTPLENPYDRDTASHPAVAPPAASPRLSRADDRLAAPADGEGDEPVSVHAHPLPTEDYRRMSAHDVTHPHSRTTITSGSFSTDSPSFSSELNGFRRFFNALHLLPWVAPDRVTVDYRPRSKSKTGVSWYLPEGAPPTTADPTSRALDTAPSPTSANGSPRNPPRHRHRRATTAADAPIPPAAYTYSFAHYPAFSPTTPLTPDSGRRPAHATPPTPGSRRPAHATPRSHRSQANRHHRRSATYHGQGHGPTAWVPPPLLQAPPTPLYIIQASPAPSPPPDLGDSPQGAPPPKPMAQMLAPVYMQMHGAGGSHGQLAFMHGTSGYAYAYSSPITTPAPAQTA